MKDHGIGDVTGKEGNHGYGVLVVEIRLARGRNSRQNFKRRRYP